MEMCFHGNQHPWATKPPFISLYSKYQSLRFICLPVMNSPVFPSLDDIYCMYPDLRDMRYCSVLWSVYYTTYNYSWMLVFNWKKNHHNQVERYVHPLFCHYYINRPPKNSISLTQLFFSLSKCDSSKKSLIDPDTTEYE